MAVHSSQFQLKTKGLCDIQDLTPKVTSIVTASKIINGIVTVFIPGSTAGVTTIEYENGVIEDLRRAIERLAPQKMHYDHDERWGDGNGFAHVRASLLGPSLSVPVTDRQLHLGTWQQIILIDFDNRPRTREVCVNIIGE